MLVLGWQRQDNHHRAEESLVPGWGRGCRDSKSGLSQNDTLSFLTLGWCELSTKYLGINVTSGVNCLISRSIRGEGAGASFLAPCSAPSSLPPCRGHVTESPHTCSCVVTSLERQHSPVFMSAYCVHTEMLSACVISVYTLFHLPWDYFHFPVEDQRG